MDWPGVGLTAAEGLLVLLLTYLLARLARRISHRASRGARMDVQLVLLVGRVVYIGVLTVGFFAFLDVVAPQYVAPVLGALGLFGLAFGLAFQDVLKNWISGFFLLLERPFNLGDWIIVATWSGRVETIRLRVTEMRALDGEKIMVPNQQVYTSAIVNRSSYASRRFVSVARIPEGADPRGLLTRALAEVTKVRGIASDPPRRVALVPRPDGQPTLEASFWISYREFDIDRVKGEVDARIAHVALGRLLDSGSDLAVARQADLMGRTDDAKLPALKPPRKSSRRSTAGGQEAPTRRPRSGSR
ncbi:MAG TPA: mechanosensitive ion channel domain-containing protein [Candidatus Solibacter sp.]|nr:mechanosensitive ion channel domain-containing protein [Candidatus Solibacter sp.]